MSDIGTGDGSGVESRIVGGSLYGLVEKTGPLWRLRRGVILEFRLVGRCLHRSNLTQKRRTAKSWKVRRLTESLIEHQDEGLPGICVGKNPTMDRFHW